VVTIYSSFKHFSILIFQIVVIILVVLLQLAYGTSGNSIHIDFFIGAQLHIHLC
jgi:hypothetical protein